MSSNEWTICLRQLDSIKYHEEIYNNKRKQMIDVWFKKLPANIDRFVGFKNEKYSAHVSHLSWQVCVLEDKNTMINKFKAIHKIILITLKKINYIKYHVAMMKFKYFKSTTSLLTINNGTHTRNESIVLLSIIKNHGSVKNKIQSSEKILRIIYVSMYVN